MNTGWTELLVSESVVRRLPANLRSGDEPLFRREYERTLSPPSMLRAGDVEALPNGFLLSNGRLLREPTAEPLRGLRAVKAKLRRIQYGLSTGRSDCMSGLWITDESSNGFFHWICDVLPRLELVPALEASRRTLIVPAMAAFPYVEPSLEPFGLSKVMIMSWSQRLACRDLMVVSTTAPTGNYRPALMRSLRDRFRGHFDVKVGTRRLYISRSAAPNRRIVNEAEVNPVLRKYGFESIQTERLSFPDQVRLIGSAAVLVGNHGAGLTNMCWMRPGTTVMELRREGDVIDNCYFSLASALDIEYRYLTAAAVNPRVEAHRADLVVDIARLEQELAALG